MFEMPIITVRLEGISQQMSTAFDDSYDEIKEYTKECIQKSMNDLTSGHLQKIITETVDEVMRKSLEKVLKDVVDDAIYEYFTKGEGREQMISALLKGLKNENS